MKRLMTAFVAVLMGLAFSVAPQAQPAQAAGELWMECTLYQSAQAPYEYFGKFHSSSTIYTEARLIDGLGRPSSYTWRAYPGYTTITYVPIILSKPFRVTLEHKINNVWVGVGAWYPMKTNAC